MISSIASLPLISFPRARKARDGRTHNLTRHGPQHGRTRVLGRQRRRVGAGTRDGQGRRAKVRIRTRSTAPVLALPSRLSQAVWVWRCSPWGSADPSPGHGLVRARASLRLGLGLGRRGSWRPVAPKWLGADCSGLRSSRASGENHPLNVPAGGWLRPSRLRSVLCPAPRLVSLASILTTLTPCPSPPSSCTRTSLLYNSFPLRSPVRVALSVGLVLVFIPVPSVYTSVALYSYARLSPFHMLSLPSPVPLSRPPISPPFPLSPSLSRVRSLALFRSRYAFALSCSLALAPPRLISPRPVRASGCVLCILSYRTLA
ncbi:hypothetical protein C8Q78DRAFT_237234 [Trametes maxima]|nr:hypothetical protein C8Q78DRAFT_237234 [Trametes maxima]